MEIYVDELPKHCNSCDLCKARNFILNKGKTRYIEVNKCALGNFYKYIKIDDEIDTCPLQLIYDHDKEVRADERNLIANRVREYLYDVENVQSYDLPYYSEILHIIEGADK